MLMTFDVHSSGEQISPEKPGFSVSSISRGKGGGQPAADCSDAGILVLESSIKLQKGVAYSIEVVKGKDKNAIFPSKPVIPTEHYFNNNQLVFVWLDGGTYEQDPINLTIGISSVSPGGVTSEQQILIISHPGVKQP